MSFNDDGDDDDALTMVRPRNKRRKDYDVHSRLHVARVCTGKHLHPESRDLSLLLCPVGQDFQAAVVFPDQPASDSTAPSVNAFRVGWLSATAAVPSLVTT